MASATYAVDDQDPINFLVPISSNSNTYYNQILFETGQLPSGQHKVVVTYYGNSTTVPLALNYFLQQDASSSSSTSSNNTTTASGSIPSASSSNSSPSSSTTIQRKPTEAIIGGITGGVVLISLLLALFFFNRRRNKRRAQTLSEKSNTVTTPSDIYVEPFTVPPSNPTSTFLPQNYASNGQSLHSSAISSKFTQRAQLTDPLSTSSSGVFPPLTSLQPESSSTTFSSPPSPSFPLTGSQTNFDVGTRSRISQPGKEPSMQRSPSPRGANARFLLHEDSGVRMPPAVNDVVELPPSYTPG